MGQKRTYGKVFNRQAYYLEEQWKRELSEDHLTLINKHLDFKVEEAAGYQALQSL